MSPYRDMEIIRKGSFLHAATLSARKVLGEVGVAAESPGSFVAQSVSAFWNSRIIEAASPAEK